MNYTKEQLIQMFNDGLLNEKWKDKLIKILTTEDHKAKRMDLLSKGKAKNPRKQPKKKVDKELWSRLGKI